MIYASVTENSFLWSGNVGNLLLVLIPAMCKEKGSTLGPPDVCHNYALAYACLSMAVSLCISVI